MRNVLSLMVAACFVLIAGLATFSGSYAALEVVKTEESQLIAPSKSHAPKSVIQNIDASDGQSAKKDEDCPCKHHHWAAKFLCGLSFATLDEPAALYVPSPAKTRYALLKPARVSEFVDRQKRPPRTIL